MSLGSIEYFYQNFFTQKDNESFKRQCFESYALLVLNKNLNMALQFDDLFEAVEIFFEETLKTDGFCILRHDEDCNELKLWKTNKEIYNTLKDITFKIGEGISGVVAQSGETILVQDISRDDSFPDYKGRISEIGSLMSIPLQLNKDQIIGVLNIHMRKTNAFQSGDKELFNSVAHSITHAIYRAKLYQKAKDESIFDELTTLYSKKYFIESCYHEFSRAKRYDKNVSIIKITFDNFRFFINSFGQFFADEFLKKFAYTISSNVRYGDIVCRFSNEEFAILLPGITKDNAMLIGDKLKVKAERILNIETKTDKIVNIIITTGIATYPKDGKTIDELIDVINSSVSEKKKDGYKKTTTVLDNTNYDSGKKINIKSFKNSLLSKEELDLLLYKNVNRTIDRHKVALKVTDGINLIRFVEINADDDNDWKICTIGDISKKGFMGELEFKAKINKIYKCKAVMDSGITMPNVFSIRIAHIQEIRYNRYRFGAEIAEGQDSWDRLFNIMKSS